MPPRGQRFQRLPSSREPSIWDQYQGEYPAKTAWEAPTYEHWYPYPFGDPYAGTGGVSPLEKLMDPGARGVTPEAPQGTLPLSQGAPAVQGGGSESLRLDAGVGLAPQIAGSALGLLQQGTLEDYQGTPSSTFTPPFGERTSDAIPPNTQPPTSTPSAGAVVGGASSPSAGFPTGGPERFTTSGGGPALAFPSGNVVDLPAGAAAGSAGFPLGGPERFTTSGGQPALAFPSGNVVDLPNAFSSIPPPVDLSGPALMNTEFLGSAAAAPASAAGSAASAGYLSIPGAIANAAMMNPYTTTGAQRAGAAVGGIGGTAGGAALGSLFFPPFGTAVGAGLGSVLGSQAGGFLSELGFGGKGTTAERQAKEAALQGHLATGALSHLGNVERGGFTIPDILNYLSSSDNLSNQGFAGEGTADYRGSIWDRMISTLLNTDPVEYGNLLLGKFHPDIVKGREAQIGQYTNPNTGIKMVWDPRFNEWVGTQPSGPAAGGTPGFFYDQFGALRSRDEDPNEQRGF